MKSKKLSLLLSLIIIMCFTLAFVCRLLGAEETYISMYGAYIIGLLGWINLAWKEYKDI